MGFAGNYLYEVELTLPSRGSGTDTTEEKKVVVRDFPRHEGGIQLYDKAFSPSWHLPQAFRHKIYIPDDIFPESWMNVDQNEQ